MDNFVNHAASGKLRSVVLGIGSYLPKRIVSNADLEKSLETTDEWIVQRTGIRQRHVAAEDEPTSRLGLYAAQAALADARLKAADLDLVIVATSTPDYTFPAVATQIQAGLGMTNGAAFDLQAVCSGFIFALATADKFLTFKTLEIIALGLIAFLGGTASGVIGVKIMNLFLNEKINPLLGSAGIASVPIAARVSHIVAAQEDPENLLIYHAMGPNLAGVLGTAISGGIMLALLGVK